MPRTSLIKGINKKNNQRFDMSEFAGAYNLKEAEEVIKKMKRKVKKVKSGKKIKTYVLIVSRFFGSKHPKNGEPTFFEESIVLGKKIHTIRTNYRFWKKRVDDINKGNAVLSVRYWTGRPYNSKQKELIKYHTLGIQKFTKITNYIEIDKRGQIYYDNVKESTIAYNDGLSYQDFNDWFRKPVTNGCIIHFTDFRYK